ncbi:hypothetical protein BJV74DRAFT_815560, partial [Russula compacta]
MQAHEKTWTSRGFRVGFLTVDMDVHFRLHMAHGHDMPFPAHALRTSCLELLLLYAPISV